MTFDVPDFPRIADYVGAWAISPTHGAALAERVKGMDIRAHIAEARSGGISSDFQRKQVGDKLIAMIPIAGLMMKSASSLGGTSTVETRRAIRAAVADTSINAIALMIDSPGGSVSGTSDLADEVRNANASKPVYAFIEDLGASAAYWVASQARRIVVNSDTAQVGSIGTLVVLYDQSQQAENDGIKTIVIGTGPLKGAGTPGAKITTEQEAYFRSMVETMQLSFDAGVSKGRRLSATQLAAVKTGGVFSAKEALRLGLIDAIQSFDAFILEAVGNQSFKAVRPAERVVMNFNDFCQSIGANPEAATPEARERLETMFRQMHPANEPAASTDELSHILRNASPLLARAMAEGWPASRANKEAQTFMKAQLANNILPNTGAVFSRGSYANTTDHLAASIMVRAGYHSAAEKSFGPNVMEQSQHLHRASMIDLCKAALAIGGHDVPSSNQQIIRAAVSTSTLPIALGSSADKIMESTWRESAPTWRSFCAIKSSPNFRQQTGLRPTFAGDLEEVGSGGQIKHGSISESTYTWTIGQFAKMYSIDRKQIINDDLSVFSELVPGLGKAAVRTLSDKVYTLLLANTGSFFAAGNSNLSTGGGSALQTSSLATAVQKMRRQTDPDGNNLDLSPAVLLVPPELEVTGRGLLNSAEVLRVTTDGLPTGNVHQGIAKLEVEPRLSNSAFSGYSTTRWYLFAGPADVPMVVAYLDGQQSPTVETFGFDADPNVLAMTFRVYHDFGTAFGDYRAAQQSDGA